MKERRSQHTQTSNSSLPLPLGGEDTADTVRDEAMGTATTQALNNGYPWAHSVEVASRLGRRGSF